MVIAIFLKMLTTGYLDTDKKLRVGLKWVRAFAQRGRIGARAVYHHLHANTHSCNMHNTPSSVQPPVMDENERIALQEKEDERLARELEARECSGGNLEV